MITKIGIFILSSCWMLSAAINDKWDNKLIALLLYWIVVLIAARKEKE